MPEENGNNMPKEISLKLSLDEANLVLEGLGHIPFARVYALVNKVQQQAGEQMNATEANLPVPQVERDSVASKV